MRDIHARTSDHGASIRARAHQTDDDDPVRLAEITADVVGEGQAHLAVARTLIDKAVLAPASGTTCTR